MKQTELHFETRTPEGDVKKVSKARVIYVKKEDGTSYEIALNPNNGSIQIRKSGVVGNALSIKIKPKWINVIEVK